MRLLHCGGHTFRGKKQPKPRSCADKALVGVSERGCDLHVVLMGETGRPHGKALIGMNCSQGVADFRWGGSHT
jgi:hypothetical protein